MAATSLGFSPQLVNSNSVGQFVKQLTEQLSIPLHTLKEMGREFASVQTFDSLQFSLLYKTIKVFATWMQPHKLIRLW